MPQLSNETIKEQRDVAFRFRGQKIVYRQRADSTNLKTGAITADNTDTEIGQDTDEDPGVLTSQVSDQEIRQSAGRYHVGDRWFRIRDEDMPEKPPSKTSQIRFPAPSDPPESSDETENYTIIEHRRSAGQMVWDVLGRVM